MDVQKLIEKRANLWDNAKKFLDEHTDADGKISAEDAASYDKMEADIVALGKQIDRFEKQVARDAELSQPTTVPIRDAIGGGFDKELRGNTKSGRATEEYRQAALTAIRTKFRKIDNALATNPDQSGGYLIPDEWDSRLIQTLEEENVMRRLGTRITTSGEHKINIAATKPAALWVAEGGQMTFGTGTFAQISLDAHKVHVGILVTEELLADNAFNLESYIVDQFGKAIANAEEDAFINGDGNGKPTGFLTTVAADTDMFFTTSGTAPTADEIVDLIYKLPRPYRKSASFLVNDSTLKLLRKFKDSNQRYLWEESYQAGEPSSFMGYKIYTSPYMPLAESGNFAIAFGDFSYYNIADRGSRSFQELRELYAGNGMVGFLLKERCDGVLIDKSAIRALKIK
ncbi:MAG: phage major capsid protein [Selenomonadaceae bacterium]|nr:phage major capsid protein [Selenomonadaceae bacterium]